MIGKIIAIMALLFLGFACTEYNAIHDRREWVSIAIYLISSVGTIAVVMA